MSDDYYTHADLLGKQAEALVIDYFVHYKGYQAKKMDHNKYPFDIGVKTCRGRKFSVEVKVYGAPSLGTIFAETLQISPKLKTQSCPEYLDYYGYIDYMMYVDLESNIGYLYNMQIFASYVLANKSKEFPIYRGTALGIKVPERSKEAGFICKLDLSSR